MQRQPRHRLASIAPHAMVGLLFYQNSTRTRFSFEAATYMLGGSCLGFSDVSMTRAGDFFQETLEDTVRVIDSYTDLIVLRHVDDDAAERAASVAAVPVINAATGHSDHPTQGMLDAMMMTRKLGTITGARIGMVGDPGCRAYRSLLKIVTLFSPAEIVFLPPDDVSVLPEQIRLLRDLGISWDLVESAAELLRRVDVTSVIPLELPDLHVANADPARRSGELNERFKLTRKLLQSVGRDTVVLHMGPRLDELPPEVDDLPNVCYFESVRSGVFLRAALMSALWESADAAPALEAPPTAGGR